MALRKKKVGHVAAPKSECSYGIEVVPPRTMGVFVANGRSVECEAGAISFVLRGEIPKYGLPGSRYDPTVGFEHLDKFLEFLGTVAARQRAAMACWPKEKTECSQ